MSVDLSEFLILSFFLYFGCFRICVCEEIPNVSLRKNRLPGSFIFRAVCPSFSVALSGLANRMHEQTHRMFVEKERMSGAHYCKIKPIHQRSLTFVTWAPALAATTPARRQEKLGFTGGFSAFCGSLRIS